MAVVGQTITIVNKSGKIVSTSKHLINVFNEAKTVYNERKAELKAQRQIERDGKELDSQARRQLEALSLADDDDLRSRRSSRRGTEGGPTVRRKPVPSSTHRRPPVERGVTDSFYANDRPREHAHRTSHRPSHSRDDSASLIYGDDPRVRELTRRHTDILDLPRQRQGDMRRRASFDDIDIDLAYGELPPPLPERRYNDEVELRMKMTGLQRVLEEANCLQHTALAVVDNLQKHPDKLAAVGLALAEISSLVSKMAPGALMGLKGSFPAIIALLASPEFAIAAGVGVGITIIAFGGYKIIKKIQAKKDARMMLESGIEVPALAESPVEESEELREIDRIESWRRGIAEAEAQTLGSSVEGEFITPRATHTLIEEGRLTEADLKPASSSSGRRHRKHRTKSEVSGSKSNSKSGAKSKSKKEPSGLRMLFKGSSK